MVEDNTQLPSPQSIFVPNPESPAVPWSFRDTLIGFGLFVLCVIGIGLLPLLFNRSGWMMSVWVIVYEPLQALPILGVLLVRRASWADLGFRRAQPNVLAIGCGLVLLAFVVNIVNNIIMLLLKVEVQAQQFTDLIDKLDQPALLLITGILIAPLIEETVFRGFLFGGLRGKLGWIKAALISSALFAAGHLSIAAFIPTFTLGFLFCYLYQRSNSLWAGIILHTLINSLGLCAVYVLSQYGGLPFFGIVR